MWWILQDVAAVNLQLRCQRGGGGGGSSPKGRASNIIQFFLYFRPLYQINVNTGTLHCSSKSDHYYTTQVSMYREWLLSKITRPHSHQCHLYFHIESTAGRTLMFINIAKPCLHIKKYVSKIFPM